MHISLDSALGQQRRLNQVGESITQIAPDPAAAYSLRSLTGGDPKVVRVRRGSDNHEQDFTASEVSSGALVDFVNAQVVAPLDIQALSATGRDGDFLIAKAAYSLRSLGTRQATLAATGDTVARADGKYVCQVRRSSDDALKSFTATEVTDGTLLAFVNEIQTLGTVTNSSGNNGFTLTNASSTGFTATTDTATGVCGWPYTAESGDKITVSFDAVIRSGTPQFLPRRATALSGSNLASVVSDSPLSVNSTGSYSFEFTYDDNLAGSLTFSEGDDNADFDISNFQVTVFKGAGLVKTWYDQSVTTQAGDTATGNHATQATAADQPKIVSAGALNADGGLLFDSSEFDLGSSVSLGSAHSIFAVAKTSTARSANFPNLLTNATNGRGIGFYSDAITNKAVANSNTDNSFNFSSNTNRKIMSVTSDATNVNGFENGTASSDNTRSQSLTTNDFKEIGGGSNFAGTIEEIIVYLSDQTDNRTAIEANIGEVYSIDLPSGVDPGFDQVDGFVETWYDQSGNGKDAVQTTAANQPKIVSAGSLVVDSSGVPELEFDGSNDALSAGTGFASSSKTIFCVNNPDSLSSNGLFAFGSSQTDRFFAQYTSNLIRTEINGAQAGVSAATQKNLTTNLHTTDISVGLNGGSFTTTSASFSGVSASAELKIGQRFGTAFVDNFDGTIQEFIVYNSDQTANRTALETNINNHYSIF
jgi:hypothetical protein